MIIIVCLYKLSWVYEGLIIFIGEYIFKLFVLKFFCIIIMMGCEDKVILWVSELINLCIIIDLEIIEFLIWNVF